MYTVIEQDTQEIYAAKVIAKSSLQKKRTKDKVRSTTPFIILISPGVSDAEILPLICCCSLRARLESIPCSSTSTSSSM